MSEKIKNVFIVLFIVGLATVIFVTSMMMLDNYLYAQELDKTELVISEFNETYEEGSNAYKVASYDCDWKTKNYCIAVHMYTGDGTLVSSVYYDNVDEFLEGES